MRLILISKRDFLRLDRPGWKKKTPDRGKPAGGVSDSNGRTSLISLDNRRTNPTPSSPGSGIRISGRRRCEKRAFAARDAGIRPGWIGRRSASIGRKRMPESWLGSPFSWFLRKSALSDSHETRSNSRSFVSGTGHSRSSRPLRPNARPCLPNPPAACMEAPPPRPGSRNP